MSPPQTTLYSIMLDYCVVISFFFYFVVIYFPVNHHNCSAVDKILKFENISVRGVYVKYRRV